MIHLTMNIPAVSFLYIRTFSYSKRKITMSMTKDELRTLWRKSIRPLTKVEKRLGRVAEEAIGGTIVERNSLRATLLIQAAIAALTVPSDPLMAHFENENIKKLIEKSQSVSRL